ncbi:MAG: 2,3-bisphosphoglycerate-independent phosphoglycerate mutase [Legionellales bacterium]|jgi:2,3-bisphosphoglycerate-independent phosphoglycerate mutase
MRSKPFLLLILDGWGHRHAAPDNAITQSRTPVWNRLWQDSPHLLLSASGEDVGLPEGQMGNSEVGHMNLGAGRIVYQDFTRIEKAIKDGEFAQNPAFSQLFKKLIADHKTLHLMGLLSPGGVHSHEKHLYALLDSAKNAGVKSIKVHVFLDGRDVPPKSAKESLLALEEKLKTLGVGEIATVMGRYYAMDRDSRWDRVKLAYDAIAQAQAPVAESAMAALEQAYQQDISDEFIKPVVVDKNYAGVHANDGIIFTNFRSDRARELSRAFIDPNFIGFDRIKIPLSAFVTMTQYAKDILSTIAFAPDNLSQVLGEVWAQNGLTQLRLAETEKYAHVTFFINGGVEAPFKNEERILIPSPKIATYDLKPQMSAIEVTDALVNAILSEKFDGMIVNYANPDMIGHTGDLNAAIKAIETIDECIGRIIAALEQVGGECVITADHGNVEQMFDNQTHQAHTAHTCELVPFVYVGHAVSVLHERGILADVAPTILQLMDLPIPEQMTGRVLLK